MMNTLTRELLHSVPVAFFESQVLPKSKSAQSFALNAWEHDGQYVLRAELVGCSKEDVQVQIQDGALWVEAKQKAFIPDQAKVLMQETMPLVLRRKIVLPKDADLQKISAQMAEGVLTLSVGKKQPQTMVVQID